MPTLDNSQQKNVPNAVDKGIPLPPIFDVPLPKDGSGNVPIIGAIQGMQGVIDSLSAILLWLSNPGRTLKLIVGIGLVFLSIYIIAEPEIQKAVTTGKAMTL